MTAGGIPGQKPLRCAIYTRKSADEAPDSQLGSTTVQRELCEAYIASQAGEGWTLAKDLYDDVGWSGGNLSRPALARLRAAIATGDVDIVVVYKIDRLSRSLRDFLALVDEMDSRGVTFVSITQAFNTTTSMGRLMVNILLSFAQFEREVTGERLRDWFAGASERGLWPRRRPYGYDKADDRLIPNPAEAEVVRKIFRRYASIGSVRQVAREINAAGHLNSRGRAFGDGVIQYILHNRLYLGEMPYRGKFIPGTHAAIVDDALWRRAHRAMDRARATCRARRREPVFAMLAGLLYGPGGYQMHHYFAYGRNGQVYRYYVARPQRQTGAPCPLGRLRAGEVEAEVARLVLGLTGYQPTNSDGTTAHALAGLIKRIVTRIDIDEHRMAVTLMTGAILDRPVPGKLAPSPRGAASRELWRRKPQSRSV